MSEYTYKYNNFTIQADIDLKSIATDILYGNNTEKARGFWVVLQRLERNESGQPIKSAYTYKNTQEGKHKNRGPATTRTGYLCKEELVKVLYRSSTKITSDDRILPAGIESTLQNVYFFAAEDKPAYRDVIVMIELDDDGNIINPVKAVDEYPITKVYPINIDGHTIFYACVIEDEN